ncbi:MAG: vanadium-dependent haloperoxidase, partial [Anaerolineae bacterium]|nr:vanadium-dependent haloperoxidase [Anaerolineae bacterium]
DMVAKRDEVALQQIAYWNSGPASYRWNQIATNAMVKRGLPGNMAFRNLALMHIAIYDATIAAWDSKYTYNRLRPSEVEAGLTTVIPNPPSPAYPSEYAVTAAAASEMLAWLYPDAAQSFKDMAQEAVNSRLMAGVEYPSDVEAGLKLGKQVAQLVIERGKADGSDAKWTGTIPTEVGHWTGENPAFATQGSWKTWVLTSGDQFRPAPPPAYDSEQMANDMAEVKAFERTPVSNAIAMFWEFGAGGRRIYWFWNDVASRSILEAGWNDNAPLAARAYALTNIAADDGAIACFDAKYTYWAMRPFQVDPEFKPLFTTPNHPSYPSAHSCISTSTATVLAELFPANAAEVLSLATEAGEARIWGGIHFRTDVVVGTKLGEDVANAVITYANSDGAS